MQSSNSPTKIPVPFADSGTKNTIPTASQIGITPGAASFTTGFPPLTFTPIAAGGVPPFGADFNGVFNAITQCLQWANAGGQYLYDSDFSTAVGGYPKGALLQKATLGGFWLSTADNNTTNPDTGGAGWADPLAGRFLGTTVITSGGTFTPNPLANRTHIRGSGGGGGGGGTMTTSTGQVSGGSGGCCGAYLEGFINGAITGTVTCTIGAAGAGTVGANGGVGGSTTFGTYATIPGGQGGIASVAGAAPFCGNGATGTNAAPTTSGMQVVLAHAGAIGGACIMVAVGNSSNVAGRGSFNPLGNSSPPVGYGVGGNGAQIGASSAGTAGGAGLAGAIIVDEWT